MSDGFLHALFVELVLAHLMASGGGDGRVLTVTAYLVVSPLFALHTRIAAGVVIFAAAGVRNLNAGKKITFSNASL